MHCHGCGVEIKAGLRPTVVVQKAMGLMLNTADRDELRSGDSRPLFCSACQERENNADMVASFLP